MAEYRINPVAQPPIGVPIGIILPYVGPLAALPAQWAPCDGRLLIDPQSQFHNQHLPNLTQSGARAKGVFLMGVDAPDDVNSPFGSNNLAPDGRHSHTGRTGTADISGFTHDHAFEAEEGDHLHDHSHALAIDAADAHTHNDGDNRPSSLGVHFIIRVK